LFSGSKRSICLRGGNAGRVAILVSIPWVVMEANPLSR
jgi:hypothetical protein